MNERPRLRRALAAVVVALATLAILSLAVSWNAPAHDRSVSLKTCSLWNDLSWAECR